MTGAPKGRLTHSNSIFSARIAGLHNQDDAAIVDRLVLSAACSAAGLQADKV